jgi:ubiquinone/menaquinone biosynthesis C-methylase UbiE
MPALVAAGDVKMRCSAMSEDMNSSVDQYQLRGSAAELYERYLVPVVTAQWARDLVGRVALRRDDRVLDVACGTGIVARVAAEQLGAGGRVVGLDLNPEMLAVARSHSPGRVEWYDGDALALPFDEREFDVVLCQFGVMFFPDPLAGLREMRRVLSPGGRAAASVFAEIEQNPVAHAFSDALDRHLGEGASSGKRREHALADRDALRGLFVEAGFARAQIDTVALTSRYPSVSDFVRFQVQATPLAGVLARHGGSERARLTSRLIEELSTTLASFVDEREFAFPQVAHVATAVV